MKPTLLILRATLAVLALLPLPAALAADALTVTVAAPAPPESGGFAMGTARAPDGTTLTLDSRSLLLDGRPWTPAMGEFHYARYPAAEWTEELRKMKAGGIDIVASYVFWIHHEEAEDAWDWSGDRDLRQFVQLAAEAGLKVIVRAGPWCHGEVRNGGIPDWVIAKGWRLRSDDPAYLARVRILYGQIAAQIAGLLWKDGGPIVGLQLENEYRGPGEHLLTLKRIAREVGIDVPLYTRTGWPELASPLPFGEIVPLYGVYAEGFWDRETTSMPGQYWSGFHFSTLRTDANIANEILGRRDVHDDPDALRYPYLTCEIGGGMMSSYHRRILVDPRDIEATTLVKLGSGSNSPGYYMYHGGTNPEGRFSTLMEEQATAITNWNDMPVKNYDFQAPLGQYGQVRPHYHLLRRLHLFLRDFGGQLAGMSPFLPDQRPQGRDDVTTLRWAVRSDGRSGFVFVNNYERRRVLPAKEGVRFTVTLEDGGTLVFPDQPVTVPSDARFIWPFGLDLGRGVTLLWATAQPVRIDDDGVTRTVVFVETPGVRPRFRVSLDPARPGAPTDRLYELSPGTETLLVPASGDGRPALRLAVLSEAESLAPIEAPPPGADQPAFADLELLRAAGPPREIPLGRSPQPVAAAPSAVDFEAAAVWRIRLPANVDLAATDLLLRLHYAGDVARVMIGGRFITDDYYNGNPLEIGLRRHAAALREGDLTVAILPLRRDAVTGPQPLIFLADSALPDFGAREAVAELRRAELVARTAP